MDINILFYSGHSESFYGSCSREGLQPYPSLDNATVVAYVRRGERMKKPEYTPEDV